MSEIMIALGGNAILRHREKGTAEEQFRHVRETSSRLAQIVGAGHEVVVTHGNGPQVGDILLKEDIAKDRLPPMPLDVCDAMSQGMIGYMMQRCLDQEFRQRGIERPVVTVLTQVAVAKDDPAFADPTKFVGPYYTALEASSLRETEGWTVVEDSGKGYRRVVPSPEPVEVLEMRTVRRLLDAGTVVIAGGGGGIPVVEAPHGELVGVEAVVDKDHTAALLGSRLGADVLLILTDVDAVSLDYGTPAERKLDRMSVGEAEGFLAEGQFPKGSMGPKVESCVRFVRATGGSAIITSLEQASDAISGDAGTRIGS